MSDPISAPGLSSHAVVDGPVTLYRVTTSSLSSVDVGSLIVDRGDESPRSWMLYSPPSGDFVRGMTGVAVGRVCPRCFAMGHPGHAGHGGPCGPTACPVKPSDAGEHDHDGPCAETCCTAEPGRCCPHCSGWPLRERPDGGTQ